jgi:hypothetical protein
LPGPTPVLASPPRKPQTNSFAYGFKKPIAPLHFSRDASVVAEARRDALQLFERDPLLADPQLARLRQLIQKRWGETLGLAQIG